MKNFTLLMKISAFAICVLVFLSTSIALSQTNRVKVSVNWPTNSYQNKVEVYDPANNLLAVICNDADCYSASGTTAQYAATYDFGCLALDPVTLPNYYIKVYNANNSAWSSGSSVTVNVAGVDVLTDNGSSASTTGHQLNFNVNSTTYCNFPDTDGDYVIDFVDLDDDNDGVLDIDEGLGLDSFNCHVPALTFFNGSLESGDGKSVGSIYRFDNATEGYDVLVEIIEVDNAELLQIDDDVQDTPDFLQTEIRFDANGTPGITFRFTIVDAGTSTPSTTIFRIGGTTWDCDGTNEYQESVRYYNPSAYGLDNPTSLTSDTYADGAGITSGNVTYGGFATNTILRSYFQFLSNTFDIRMQLKKTTTTSRTRLYAMSFTQCDIFTYKAPTLTVLAGVDTDGDGLTNHLDLDSDNDGIPDNVEFQGTTTYIGPNNVIDYTTGVDTAYSSGITIVDTDGDNTPDFMDFDSDNDGLLDIQENGMADAIVTFADDDGDGLDNLFETNGTNDPTFDINEDIENPAASILPDTDGDLASGGDLDYRDNLDSFFQEATLDFDGVDDYVDSDFDYSGMTKMTTMAWIKLDPAFSNNGTIISQGDFLLDINAAKRISTSVNTGTIFLDNSDALELNKWYHITVIFDSSLASDNLKLYVNGVLKGTKSNPSLSSPMVVSADKFTIGKPASSNINYFKGAIDEVRVFNSAVSEEHLRQMIHQEIDNNGGLIKGKVVPKNIVDFNSGATISWNELELYYPMTDIINSEIYDHSKNDFTAVLHNIRTMQAQTAPMPYATKADGNWEAATTWVSGDVWDIVDNPKANEWSIFKISHNMVATNDISSKGLIIDAGKTLTISGSNKVVNDWYLELNGTLDLQDDSQLIQSRESDLVTSADGKILRRQEGTASAFWYNYWSSPVGSQSAITLSDNNGPSNNTNNTPFSLNMLKDSTGNPVQFTNAYSEEGKISTFWLYTFQNGITYYDWNSIDQNTLIQPGLGYTQKGTGVSGSEQQFIFEGKPNNGTILIAADDVDGDSGNESEEGVTLTSTLVGNPYPSALNAVQFINDNKPGTGTGVISGTLLLWEQWAGTSHYLADYQGGYGYINTLTTERAYQHPDIPIADQVITEGIKTPTFHIPVGQGFYVEVIEDGDIEFNNGQRVFALESDSDGVDPNNGSMFFRTNQTNTETGNETNESAFQLIRFEFTTSEGASRRFVLGFGEDATEGYDYGLDGGLVENPPADDMGSILNGKQYVIQAFSPITSDKEIDLTLNSSGNFTYGLKAVEISNFDGQEIYLKDTFTNTYFDLTTGDTYDFTSEPGQFNDRFKIVFKSGETLDAEEFRLNNALIYVNQIEDVLYVKSLEAKASQLTITNTIGQKVKSLHVDNNMLENGISVSDLSSGVYVVSIFTENNQSIDKKVIIN